MRIIFALGGIGIALMALCGPVESCCMVPATYRGTIGQTAQEAVILYHDGREELILKINYKITGNPPPEQFAWVITVPNEPEKDGYAVVTDEKFFAKMFAWSSRLVIPPPPRNTLSNSNAAGSKGTGDLYIGQPVKVGPYDIVPVRALGKEALSGLNDWLQTNGFPTEDPRHMEYFVQNNFTFLCVKFSPPKNRRTVEAESGVPPLHLSFKSSDIYYPLRFSSRQGIFDVNLYVITKKQFDYKNSSDSLKRINWAPEGLKRNVLVEPASFPDTLREIYMKSTFKDETGNWYLNVLRTKGTNRNNAIARWSEDIFFKTTG
jgi:hypothetical protein